MSGSLLVADAAVNATRNKWVKGFWSHSSCINHPVHDPWITPCSPWAAENPLDSGAELLPQHQSCIHRDVCRGSTSPRDAWGVVNWKLSLG